MAARISGSRSKHVEGAVLRRLKHRALCCCRGRGGCEVEPEDILFVLMSFKEGGIKHLGRLLGFVRGDRHVHFRQLLALIES